MKRTLSIIQAGSIAVLVAISLFCVNATATAQGLVKPSKYKFSYTADPSPTTVTRADGTQFDITIKTTWQISGVKTFDSKKNIWILNEQVVEQDDFEGPEMTLSSYPYNYTYRAEYTNNNGKLGTLISAQALGRLCLVPLPDGNVFRSSGMINYATGVQFCPDHGACMNEELFFDFLQYGDIP